MAAGFKSGDYSPLCKIKEINIKFVELLKKTENNEQLSKEELIYLLSFSPDSLEAYQIMS